MLLLAIICSGEGLVLCMAMAGAWCHNAHPGHEQGEIIGVDVAHGTEQAVHSLLQHYVAGQRHGPVVQQPVRERRIIRAN